jgi:hypothetical protein
VQCDYIIHVDKPLGCGLKAGDVAYCGGTDFMAGDRVLLRAVAEKAFVPNMIRTVRFNQRMEPVFEAEDDGYPAVAMEDYIPVAKVKAVLSMS